MSTKQISPPTHTDRLSTMAPWTGQALRFGVVILAFAWLVIVGATWNS